MIEESEHESPRGEEQQNLLDLSRMSTPKQDVQMLKAEAVQKEKANFLEELKNQDFLMSENSTVRLEKKDIMKLNEQSKLEKNNMINNMSMQPQQ